MTKCLSWRYVSIFNNTGDSKEGNLRLCFLNTYSVPQYASAITEIGSCQRAGRKGEKLERFIGWDLEAYSKLFYTAKTYHTKKQHIKKMPDCSTHTTFHNPQEKKEIHIHTG